MGFIYAASFVVHLLFPSDTYIFTILEKLKGSVKFDTNSLKRPCGNRDFLILL